MADIFFSYSSKDRDRVQPVHDALVNRGFAVFWDQEIPASTDWDSWIRHHLNESKCALVVWSANSVASDNVRHEAFIAKQQNKLVPILIDSIAADQFPMGLYAVQAANLTNWIGDLDDREWLKLITEVESRLMPRWVRGTLDAFEAELVSERARRDTAERRDRTLRDQIARGAEAQQNLRAELDQALHQVDDLRALANTESARHQAAAARLMELNKDIANGDERRRTGECAFAAQYGRAGGSTSCGSKRTCD
jgi:hypothetical protein